MTININPLGWNDTKLTRDINKDYINKAFPFIVPNSEILPFQITKRTTYPPSLLKTYTFEYLAADVGNPVSIFGAFDFPSGNNDIRMSCIIKFLVNDVVTEHLICNLANDENVIGAAALAIDISLVDQSVIVDYTGIEEVYNKYILLLENTTNNLNIPSGTKVELTNVKFIDNNANFIEPISAVGIDGATSVVESGEDGYGPYLISIINEKTGVTAYSGSIDIEGKTDTSDNRFYNYRHFGGDIGYDLENGLYSATFQDNYGGVWYSELFCIKNDVSDFLKIKYSAKDDLVLPEQRVDFSNSFEFEVYLDTVVARPDYQYIEEAEEKNGYTFYSLQVAKKTNRFSLPLPEYLVDALLMVRLCDFILITTNKKTFNAIEFLITPEADEYGDIFNCDFEFGVGEIMKKVNAFRNIDNLGEYSSTAYNESYKNNLG